MGCQHSTSSPTEADFLVEHKPLPVSLLEKAPLVEYSFRIPQKAWRKQAISVDGMGVTLKLDDKTNCVLVSDKNGEVRAVLQAKNKNEIHVRSVAPLVKGVAAVGNRAGQPLYEYAVISRNTQNRSLLIMKLAEGGSFQTTRCGSSLSRQVNLVVKHRGIVCASLVETQEVSQKVWDCRVGPGGIEPALLVALLLAQDKFSQIDKEIMRSSSGMMEFKFSNIL